MQFAAFEISALVTLGERWLILTPLVVLPMAWYVFEHFHLQISVTMCAFLKLGTIGIKNDYMCIILKKLRLLKAIILSQLTIL